MEFDWDEANVTHIARHGVSRVETEEALIDPLAEMIDSEIVGEEVRYRQVGSTSGGRILIVIFALRGDTVRPVTAFEATRFMARRYRHGSLQQ